MSNHIPKKQPYHSPKLSTYGSVNELTQQGSSGTKADSAGRNMSAT